MSDQTSLDTHMESVLSSRGYPVYMESQEIMWSFFRKVFFVVAIILLFSTAVGASVISSPPLFTFLTSTTAGLTCYALLVLCPFIALLPLYYYSDRRHVIYVLLGIFAVGFSFAIGLSCAFTGARFILEALILTSAMVVSLMLFTFWAGLRGQGHYGFLLCGVITVLSVAAVIQIFFPLVKISMMICASLYAIICVYLITDTNFLITRYTYDEYIWAGVDLYLYLDIFRLIGYCVSMLRGNDAEVYIP